MLEALLTTREVADLLGVSTRTIFNLTVPRGGLPRIKINRIVRYPRSDVLEYLEAHRQKPPRTEDTNLNA